MTTSSKQSALYAYCLRLLARREYSQAELRHKALSHHAGFAPDLVEQVLAQLQQANLQSDERFAASFIRSKSQRGQGLHKITQALREKGIDPDLTQTTLAAENLDFVQSALALYQRKYQSPATTPQERAKRMRFLAGRGFDFSTINMVLKSDFSTP